MGNEQATQASDDTILVGQSLASHGYRIIKSTIYEQSLHPFIDYIVYDPAQNGGKLMSEHILEVIFAAIVQV
jgi:hypothetical protein